MSPDDSQLNQLSCLKQFPQIQLIVLPSAWTNQKILKAILSVYIAFIVFLVWSADRCICNNNRTELSPMRAVIIPVSNKMSPTSTKWQSKLLIKSVITDKIRRHEVLLPIYHKYYTFQESQKGKKMLNSQNHPLNNFVNNFGFLHLIIFKVFYWFI